MKMLFVILTSVFFLFFPCAFAETNTTDKELSALADKLVAGIKSSGMKKVTVLDFTDLQGSSSELGRYIAQQLTLNLVESTNRQFSVLDRAHRESILAEHKLTNKGLINPDTAKKFGQFAGVDSLVLGSIVPSEQEVQIFAEIITTETSEVVSAGKVRVPKTKELQELMGVNLAFAQTGAANNDSATQEPIKQDFSSGKSSFTFKGLSVSLDSFRILKDNRIAAVLSFKNLSSDVAVRICLKAESGELGSTLVDELGNNYTGRPDEVKGVFVHEANRGSFGDPPSPPNMTNATAIDPAEMISAHVSFSRRGFGRPVEGSVFKLYCSFAAAIKDKGKETTKDYSFTVEGIKPLLPKPTER